jgi:hypothetical protein
MFHLTFAVQSLRRLTMCCWPQVILVPLKLDLVSLLIGNPVLGEQIPAVTKGVEKPAA